MKHLLLILAFLLLSISGCAQDSPEMADALRQDGKFWVVVIGVLIILLGLLSWVFLLDRKLTKIEKEHSKK